MKQIFLICLVFILLISCETKRNKNTSDSESIDSTIVPDNLIESEEIAEYDIYVNKELHVGDVELEFVNPADESELLVKINEETFPVLTYQGILKGGFGISKGLLKLIFEPYNYWDDNLDMIIESAYNFDLHLMLTTVQNSILGYINFNSDTDNIAWDYHENLFTIYYYENEKGELFPLNFIDLGKTDWDG